MRLHHRSTLVTFCSLCLFFITSADADAPAVVLDSLAGKAQVQRAGTVKWLPLKQKSKLFNNDMVRIAPEGHGKLRWPDNSMVYMKGGAQILVNIGPSDTKERLLNYATVFMGSVFFVIKKTLPRSATQNIQIYTPTSVISIRGTSFAINVEPETGASQIKALCGTIRVSCIANHASAFISAPFKTLVEKLTDPVTSIPMQGAEIKELHSWVPRAVIENEIALHLAQGKRNQMVISGRMDKNCTITTFKNGSKYTGTWDIQHRLPELLAERLKTANPHLTVEISDSLPVRDSSATNGKDISYIISGSVTFLDIIDHAEITVRADEYRERSTGRVQLELSLFDATGNTDLLQTTVTGEHSGKKNNANTIAESEKLPFDPENKAFASSLIGSAVSQALDQAVEKLTKAMFQ